MCCAQQAVYTGQGKADAEWQVGAVVDNVVLCSWIACASCRVQWPSLSGWSMTQGTKGFKSTDKYSGHSPAQ